VLIVAGLALMPTLAPLAQRVKESQSPINVTGVGVRQTGGGAVVTVSADAPLSRTQTWQDGDKFHLILPYAAGSQLKNLPRGVRVNRVSNSLEIVVNMKSGASVTVDPRFNRLNLIVNGGLNSSAKDADDEADTTPRAARTIGSAAARETRETIEPQSRFARERNFPAESASLNPFAQSRSTTAGAKSLASLSAQKPSVNEASPDAPNQTRPIAAPAEVAPPANTETPANTPNSTQLVPAQEENLSPAASATQDANAAADAVQPPGAQSETTQNSGLFSAIFSTTGVMIIISLALLSLVYLRLRGPKSGKDEDGLEEVEAIAPAVALEVRTAAPPVVKNEERKGERRRFMRRKSDKLAAAQAKANLAPARNAEQMLEARTQPSSSASAVLFGAYRVDQEVGKLALGQPHRMDVLASRALDDRRAIETSLLKVMNATETDEDGRRRTRQALEEYGFIARHSAALLLAQEPCDRAAAARTLGEIGVTSALPFLLEALYDADASVRAQAVGSLGALKLPSAIGALLDMARRHPEMPAALLSQALSACSLDCLDIGGVFEPERPLLAVGAGSNEFNGEITRLEPSGSYEQLPEFLEDETLAEALERLENMDVEVRMASARRLGQFQTQQSVAALTALAARDSESSVRAAAVSSLGEIDHESVFAPVLMAFVDEAREVQAAAARSLSRLSFNRADAYVRIIETADEESLKSVARACIKARMAAQAIDRLASEDRRQAYEAFSLLSLLAKAGEIAPLLDAIAEHRERNVQMAAIRLLGMTGGPEVAQNFRQLAVRDGLPEQVRTSLLEVVYKIDQALPV
jgi:HEAT repeat protein